MTTSELIDKLGDDAMDALDAAKGQVGMERFGDALIILDDARDSIMAAKMVMVQTTTNHELDDEIPY